MAYSEDDIAFAKRAWKLREDTRGGSQVGAVVVSIGEGTSRLPPNMPYIDDVSYLDHVIHAEINAISDWERRERSLYTTKFPCEDCARAIVETNINRVVYIEDCILNPGSEILEGYGIECIRIPKETLGI